MVLMREMEGDRHRGMDAHTVSVVALTCITCVFCPSRERESETYGRQCGLINVYYMRVLSQQESDGACCQAICRPLIPGSDQWKVGKSKIFLKVR